MKSTARKKELFLLFVIFLVSCRAAPKNAVSAPEGENSHEALATPASKDTNCLSEIRTGSRLECVNAEDKQWISERDALKNVINDVAFQQQRPSLEAFYADANMLREEHRASLQQAMDAKDEESLWHWFAVVDCRVRVIAVLEFIQELSNMSRKDAMLDINSSLASISTYMDKYYPIATAYMNSGEELQARFRVDPKRIAVANDRVGDLPQRVANYIKADDLLSAFVAVTHARMVVSEMEYSLGPFEVQIYRKSHPGK